MSWRLLSNSCLCQGYVIGLCQRFPSFELLFFSAIDRERELHDHAGEPKNSFAYYPEYVLELVPPIGVRCSDFALAHHILWSLSPLHLYWHTRPPSTMADIRALLRNELASRNTSGSRPVKKRKHDIENDDVRKRAKPEKQAELDTEPQLQAPPPSQDTTTGKEPADVARPVPLAQHPEPSAAPLLEGELGSTTTTEPKVAPQQRQEIDEDEWSAFEREVAQPTRAPVPPAAAALNQQATISAAPVSAAELASREREERESRAKAQEAAASGDQEDATRLLEEELDEMEQLDQRVQRLKAMREELRRKRVESERVESGIPAETKELVETAQQPNDNVEKESDENDDDDDDEEEDDEVWDNWRFR